MNFRVNRDNHVEFLDGAVWRRPTVTDMSDWSKQDCLTYAVLVTFVLDQHQEFVR